MTAENGSIFGNDGMLIMLLLLIIMREKKDSNLVFALLYLLM